MQLTKKEIEAVALSPERLAEAVRTFRDTGLVLIEKAFDSRFIASVREAYEGELERFLEAKGGLKALEGKTFGKNHIGFFPPLKPPLSDTLIAGHPIAVQIMRVLLGDDFQCSFYHTNTALPGSEFQPIHRDTPPLFGPEMGVPTPAFSLVLNLPLCDFTEENGSTEYWPGSHLIVDPEPFNAMTPEARAERAAFLPSIRLNMPVGSFALRDLRAWHRGMPNNADYARTMFALVYQRNFMEYKPITIPQSVWESWPEAVRNIYRKNRVVPDSEHRPISWEELG